MYEPYRQEGRLTLSINWERNTALGFAWSLILAALIIFLMSFFVIPKKQFAKLLEQSASLAGWEISEISFGLGDGTGGSKGNLTKEGELALGREPRDDLEDAQRKAKKANADAAVPESSELPANIVPSAATAVNGEKGDESAGTGTENVGSPDGSKTGTGLGETGDGKGLGYGLGKISWGGGGNRIVSFKPPKPKYPEGVNIRYAVVVVKFWVDANGSVINVQLIQKADPRLDNLTVKYIKRYKFNPIEEDKVMTGSFSMVWELKYSSN